jgi:signal transduction histidine kinase
MMERMRSFGEETLEPQGLELTFSGDSASDIVLHPNVRHQMFLIFKEAIHNVVQHSSATGVRVELSTKAHRLTLRIADNGRGLPPGQGNYGHGLRNMRERITSLGGTMRVDTGSNERGTMLEFTVPLTKVRR